VATFSSLESLTPVGLSSGTDVFTDYTTDVLSRLSQKQIRHLGKRSRSRIRDPDSEPSPVATVSPTIRSIFRSSANAVTTTLRSIFRRSANAVTTTFSSSFDFTDNQKAFDDFFPITTSEIFSIPCEFCGTASDKTGSMFFRTNGFSVSP
jgi:hypothetical protein